MQTNLIEPAKHSVSVRWPFRILAAFFVLFCVAALIGTVVAVWLRGPGLLKWQFLVNLPGVAWFARLAWQAAIHGDVKGPAYWPFRTQRMFNYYMILWVVALFL